MKITENGFEMDRNFTEVTVKTPDGERKGYYPTEKYEAKGKKLEELLATCIFTFEVGQTRHTCKSPRIDEVIPYLQDINFYCEPKQ